MSIAAAVSLSTLVRIAAAAPSVPPLDVWATAGDRSALVTWTPPSAPAAPSRYEVRALPSAVQISVASTSTAVVVGGLENGVSYRFVVAAIDAAGMASESESSNAIVPAQKGIGSTAVEPMYPARAASSVLLKDGRALLAGGSGNAVSASLFDPSKRTWTTVGGAPLWGAALTVLRDGRVLRAGGSSSYPLPADGNGLRASTSIFDPSTNEWSATGALKTARAYAATTLLPDGRVLLAGGEGMVPAGGEPTTALQHCCGSLAGAHLYDPTTGIWTVVSSLHASRSHFALVLLPNGLVLAAGGTSGNATELYDPRTNTWTPTGALPIPSPSSKAVLLPGGNVLMAAPGNVTEIYDPRSGTWSVTGPRTSATAVDALTLLPSGNVLATSGAHAEIFNPATGRWVATKDLLYQNIDRTATLLPNGDVLLAGGAMPNPYGGYDVNGNTELYGRPTQGYWVAGADGGVFAFGDVRFAGSAGNLRLNRPVVSLAATPSQNGYWLVASDGGTFTFGDARFFGSAGAIVLNKPVVAAAGTPFGDGYWLVASDGGVFAYGAARFYGSTGNQRLSASIVGIAATPSGDGYWLVAADGGVFAFGAARFYGSAAQLKLNAPIVAMASSRLGTGYWLVSADGGIFAFGDARFLGSAGGVRLNQPVVDISATATGAGYALAAADGGIFSYGDASFVGSALGLALNSPVVALAP